MPTRGLLVALLLALALPATLGAAGSSHEPGPLRKAEIFSAIPQLLEVEARLEPGEKIEVFLLSTVRNSQGDLRFREEHLSLGSTRPPGQSKGSPGQGKGLLTPDAWPGGVVEWFSYGDLPSIPGPQAAREAQTAYGLWAPMAPQLEHRYRGELTGEIDSTIIPLSDGRNEAFFAPLPGFPNPFDCTTAEIVGMALYRTSGTHMVEDRQLETIQESVFWIRPGVDECAPPFLFQTLFAHEVGHTYGLRHSCGETDLPPCQPGTSAFDAVMNPSIFGTALPRAADRDQMEFRYGVSSALPYCPAAITFQEVPLEVSVAWQRQDGTTGCAAAVDSELPNNSANLYFFQPDNWELTLKGLDGCSNNQHSWLFLSGLTNLATEITVRDTERNTFKKYTSSLGEPFPPILDTTAFRNCP
ncbi:MAG: zinc-dependent metalloprotease [Deltaproteobacteria bacterium]|nr:zinc-dependent metalloprotease [Deltaproteobacteria bacterium]